jgi:glyoxylase-like metal-dependent hydrolase (beta-lactamase superfamily II)
MPSPPVQLATGVWRIPTLGSSAINSYAVLDDDGTLALIDAGLKGAPKRLLAALSLIGKRPADVSKILLTHAHFDHVGGAATMRQHTGAPVHIGEHDASFLREGKRPPIDTSRPLGKVFTYFGTKVPSCEVDGMLKEGDVVPVGGGIRVLHTPGHSPGHCSFLFERSGILVTGDSIFNWRNKMAYSTAAFCSNFALSKDTAERLGEVDYEVVAFTHGPEIKDNARNAVRQFLSRRARDT